MTPIFRGDDSDRVFGIAPGQDFSRDFVAGLLDRFADRPAEDLARVTVFTNTQRAARRLEVVFAEAGAILLPRIRVISDLAADPQLGPPNDTEPAIATRLRLTQLVRRLLETEPGLSPTVAAFDLAGSLGDLMDEMAGAGVSVDALDALRIDTAAHHWQTALKFLRLVGAVWPQGAAQDGPDARQRVAVDTLAAHWAQHPPAGPVIVAGSTGVLR